MPDRAAEGKLFSHPCQGLSYWDALLVHILVEDILILVEETGGFWLCLIV